MPNSTKINYCYIPDCNKRCVGRGLCKIHYQRWRRHANPDAVLPKGRSLDFKTADEKFEHHLKSVQLFEHGCWNWPLKANNQGYGFFNWDHNTWQAHRYSYVYHYKAILDDDICVCHKCDNPMCINPDHLFLGTRQDNNLDRHIKGRTAQQKGSDNPFSKLNEVQVKEIKLKLKNGALGKILASAYNVHTTTISLINRNKTWQHVQI